MTTLLDEILAHNPLIKKGGIRFYAGVPLINNEGFALGTLCIIDYIPKALTDKQIETLRKIGETVTKTLIGKSDCRQYSG